MARFLIAPDSFKGTLTSLEAARTISEALRETVPGSRCRCAALADGGDGTIEALLATLGGEEVEAEVTGPAGTPVRANYAILTNGSAVIEMAAACGARLAPEGLNPGKATTRGVGELLLDAAQRGCTKIMLGLGSSATNDGGCGAAYACGVRFLDRYVEPFEPCGATLNAVESIDISGIDPVLKTVDIKTLYAVENPLCGILGTSAIFAPPKGALPSMVSQLDANLAHYAEVIQRTLGVDILDLRCGGAEGGMAAGMAAFFGVEPQLGIDVVLDMFDIDTRLADVDYVVSGEGCFDAQSLHGKVVSGIARHCKAAGVPLIAVVGTMDEAVAEAGAALGVTSFVLLNSSNKPLAQLERHPRSQLARAMMHVGALIAAGDELPLIIGPVSESATSC